MPLKKTTTPMTDEAIRALIAQGVADALAEHEANRSRNGDDNHDSGTDEIRRMPVAREIVSHEVAYGMTWKALKKTMTDKYCPRDEIKKLEIELWNLKVKESDEVEKYVGLLPDMIQGSVMASKPETMQDAIEFATELMDQKIYTFSERQAENKRKLDNDNQVQQQPPKKQNVARAYSAGSSEKKEYAGTLPLCNKCKFHHNGSCTNHGNQAEGTEARGMMYALGGGETDQDLDDMEDDINA
ncbi:hypothetical protein Tco_0067429 [Tanacetum coccineum]